MGIRTEEWKRAKPMLELTFTTLTLGVLSALALILGAVGLYGTLSYVVAQRTKEIGVVAAFVTTRFLGRLRYDVKPVDPLVFAATSAIMLGIGVLASYVPARRASGVDPMEALRGASKRLRWKPHWSAGSLDSGTNIRE